MMGQRMMGGGMMGRMGQDKQGMMGMGPGRMQSSAAQGMASVFGSRVTPMMNLSVEDVQGHLTAQLDRLKNKRAQDRGHQDRRRNYYRRYSNYR
jgi:hypothetical protein